MNIKNIFQKVIIVPMTLIIIVMSVTLIVVVHIAKLGRKVFLIFFKNKSANFQNQEAQQSAPETIKDSFAIATKKC